MSNFDPREQCPWCGQVVRIKDAVEDLGGKEYRIEDWWTRVFGRSWMVAKGNPAAINYAIRSGLAGLPTDDLVLYGKIGSLGRLLHVSELELPMPATEMTQQ